MIPWLRDVLAVLGVAFLAAAAYLVHPALALAFIGAVFLLAWLYSVPEKDEANDGS